MLKQFFIFAFSYTVLFGAVENSTIPMNTDSDQEKLSVMSFNMLYNDQKAENKLPIKHQWPNRKHRLFEYLDYARADLICSQELQESQMVEVGAFLSSNYSYCGGKIRTAEDRSDTNAIFFKKERLELLCHHTIPYRNPGGNGFIYCYFKDKLTDRKFLVINTKLSWGFFSSSKKERSWEAQKLLQFVNSQPKEMPILLAGDFNTLHFLDGKKIVRFLSQDRLRDAKTVSQSGHTGPFCSVNNSSFFFTPFTGPELNGLILDRIFVNNQISVIAHTIDIAKVNGEFASDHFPVIALIHFR